MHRLDSTTLGTKEYATKQYIHRTENRINELLGCLSVEEKNLYSLVTDNGILFERIIKKVKGNIGFLVPEKLVTVHGQLGPAHIIKKNDGKIKLIDPKGISVLHDEIIDSVKLGKAILYNTEWLETGSYLPISIEKIERGNTELKILKPLLTPYHLFDTMMSGIYERVDADFRFKMHLAILIDLVGGLPFAYATNGIERTIALTMQIRKCLNEMEDIYE